MITGDVLSYVSVDYQMIWQHRWQSDKNTLLLARLRLNLCSNHPQHLT